MIKESTIEVAPSYTSLQLKRTNYPISCTQAETKSFYVQPKFFVSQNVNYISPSTKAAADMLLSDKAKTILHDIQ